jgi:NodT family efflux transporter outer membrane factor (OMF) lipoprotein
MVIRISRPSSGVVAIVLTSVLAASCMVGPNYTRPAVPTPAGFRAGDTAATNVSLADTKWFDLFQDQTLTQLVNGALQQNFDLRIAAERVLQARALFRVTRADQFPTVDASASIIQTRIPTVGANAGAPPDAIDRDFGYAQAGFNLGWEIDVWGRLRRLTESARAQYFATEEARRGVVTTLVADVTESYLALRALDLELAIARRTQQVATDSMRLTQTRFDRGIATALDVQQAEQLLRIAGVQIAGLERDIAQTENALSLLLGQVPGDIPRGLELEAFRLPPTVPAGLPSALLERRPDIRQAEQELIAANARIGAAKAEYFPRISLTGVLGLQSRSLGDLLTGAATNWTVAAGATAPIFNAGRTAANVRFTEAQQRELIVNYQKTIYTALREVSDSLAGYHKTSDQRSEQERLVAALQTSSRLATERYQGGVDTYLQVLDAQRNLFQGELDLARLRQQELSSLVQLYRALGGGWDPATAKNDTTS